MQPGQGGNLNVSPHGIILFAAFGLAVVFLINMLGFRVVAALRVGR
jgi:hypothetical protein